MKLRARIADGSLMAGTLTAYVPALIAWLARRRKAEEAIKQEPLDRATND